MSFRRNACTSTRLSLVFIAAIATLATPATARLLPVTPQQVARLGIETQPVRPAATKSMVSVLGRVAPAPDARIAVAAPFAGTVQKLVRLEGEHVNKGDALAVIVSADMHAALAKLQGQEAHYRTAKAASDRAKALVAEGIAPASRAEEAGATAAEAAAELASLRSATARASHSGNGEYRLLAPASGRVAAISAATGDQVTAMQPVLAIETGTEMWVEGALPAAMIGQVRAGDSVLVEQGGASGEVLAAGSSIDPKTRSAMVRARLTAPGQLVSGQTVRMSIIRKADAGSFNVPRNAVTMMKTGAAVFVARKGGFEAVPVRLLARGPQWATIAGQVSARDAVAVAGVSELKSISAQE